MNKEKFTAELVCLLDVASRPQDVAEFKQLVESFFIAGAARIDLIAESMNLDNDIGGYKFDIPLLAQTKKAIEVATQTKGNFVNVSSRILPPFAFLNAEVFKKITYKFLILIREYAERLTSCSIW